jgi:hypothetical protein
VRLGWVLEPLLRPHMMPQQSEPRVSAVVALFLCVVSFAHAAPAQEVRQLPEVLTNPQWLSSRTWKLDEGLESLVRNWPAYGEKQQFEEKTILKRARLKVLGATFDAEYRVFKKDQVAEIALHGNEFGQRFCSAFLDRSAERLGRPFKLFDLSRGPEQSYVEIRAEWLFGETRVQFLCTGTTFSAKFIPLLATIVYRQKDSPRAPIDLVYLECSASTKKDVGPDPPKPAEQEAPIILIIDTFREALLDQNKVYLGKTTKYSEEEITVSLETGKSTGVFRLDRITGNYLWTARVKADSRLGLETSGKCSAIAPEKRS